MANLCLAALETLRGHLLTPGGLNDRLAAISERDSIGFPTLDGRHVAIRHLPPDLTDANTASVYPAVFIYCERLENRQEAKFSDFSGRLFLAADLRVTAEKPGQLDGMAARLTEAFTATLGLHRGRWTENLAFDGRYEVRFEAARLGGKNFLQTAKVTIELLANA
jgi:hypothetical protein